MSKLTLQEELAQADELLANDPQTVLHAAHYLTSPDWLEAAKDLSAVGRARIRLLLLQAVATLEDEEGAETQTAEDTENMAETPVDSAELVRRMELPAQYARHLETLKHFDLLREGDAPLPSLERVLASFTPEKLAIASKFQKPTLLMQPETDFARLVKAIDSHKIKGQVDTYVNELYTLDESKADAPIVGWKAVIVDGAHQMKPYKGDDLNQCFEKRVAARKKVRKLGEAGMDRIKYMMLMMETLADKSPVDTQTYTLLDDDQFPNGSIVPHAYWSADQVYFNWGNPGHEGSNARLRSSVEGDEIA